MERLPLPDLFKLQYRFHELHVYTRTIMLGSIRRVSRLTKVLGFSLLRNEKLCVGYSVKFLYINERILIFSRYSYSYHKNSTYSYFLLNFHMHT